MNENRSVFSIHGITGMLIATVLLLSILAFLTVLALGTQQANAENYYKLDKPFDIEKINPNNVNHVVDAK